MPLPKSVKVGALIYEIKASHDRLESDSLGGSIVYKPLIIHIDEQMPEMRQREALLHEIIHALTQPAFDEKEALTSEMVTRPTAAGLMAVFVDNPEVAHFITGV